MKKKDFDNLVTSIRQAGRIKRGEIKPSRVTEFAPVDVRAIRQRLPARISTISAVSTIHPTPA